MANVKNATSELEGSKVDPGEESMNSVANEKVNKVEVDAIKQRKLEEDIRPKHQSNHLPPSANIKRHNLSTRFVSSQIL